MQKWLISANPKKYDHSSAFAKFGYIDWIQNANFSVGDDVYIYCARPYQKIMYKTKVISIGLTFEEITNDKEFWKDLTQYENGRSGRFTRLKLITQADNNNLSLINLQNHGLKTAPQGPIRMKDELAIYVDIFLNDYLSTNELGEEEIPLDCYEGAKYSIITNKYERSSIARMKCIEKHGCTCSICGFNFEHFYGDLGKGFIHIHHLVPLHIIGKEYKVDYDNDLIPVCPNCHAMLHRDKSGKISPKDLKIIIGKQQNITK